MRERLHLLAAVDEEVGRERVHLLHAPIGNDEHVAAVREPSRAFDAERRAVDEQRVGRDRADRLEGVDGAREHTRDVVEGRTCVDGRRRAGERHAVTSPGLVARGPHLERGAVERQPRPRGPLGPFDGEGGLRRLRTQPLHRACAIDIERDRTGARLQKRARRRCVDDAGTRCNDDVTAVERCVERHVLADAEGRFALVLEDDRGVADALVEVEEAHAQRLCRERARGALARA